MYRFGMLGSRQGARDVLSQERMGLQTGQGMRHVFSQHHLSIDTNADS